MAPTEWPAFNTRAWLRLECCGAEHPTRVEDFEKDDCMIAAPVAPHQRPVDPPAPKKGFFLGWVHKELGAVEMPVSLVKNAEEPLPTWTLKSIGSVATTQRRQYVRLQYTTEVRLFLLEGSGAPSKAETLDVSEGGLRCTVDEWAIDPGPRAFRAEFSFGGKNFFATCQMAWWGKLDEKDRRTIGVEFVNMDQPTADSIRSYIFNVQLEERRKKMQ